MANKDKKAINDEFKFGMTAWRGYVQAKMEDTGEKITRMDNKLDRLLDKDLATNDGIRDAIEAHIETCPVRTNPGKSKSETILERGLDAWVSTYCRIGIVGALIGIIGLLVVVLLKSEGVF